MTILDNTSLYQEPYSNKSLSIVQRWHDSSIYNTHFVPQDNESSQYYLSHPPLSYYTLYIFQIISGTQSYYYLNSILVSLSAFFIYLTILLLSLKKAKKESSIFSWIGMIIYISSYPILKYQYFNYHPDIFVLTILIIAQYVFLKLLMKERYRSIKYILLLTILLSILNYSSWFGAVFSLIICLLGIYNLRKSYKQFPYIILTIGICFAMIFLTIYQYSVVGGWANAIYYFKDTYLRESPLFGNIKSSTIEIFIHIIKYLGVLILSFIGLIIYSLVSKKPKFLFTKNGYRYLVLSLFPIIIYSILLIQYFQNNFACLYFVPSLVVSICIWLEKLFDVENNKSKLIKIVLLIVLSNLSLFFIL